MMRAARRVLVALVSVEGCAARAGHVRRLAGAAGHPAFVRRREGARRDRAREHDDEQPRRQNDSGDWRASLNACSARNWQREISVRAARRLPVTGGFCHRRKVKGKRKSEDPFGVFTLCFCLLPYTVGASPVVAAGSTSPARTTVRWSGRKYLRIAALTSSTVTAWMICG